jgi:hypothetical protein
MELGMLYFLYYIHRASTILDNNEMLPKELEILKKLQLQYVIIENHMKILKLQKTITKLLTKKKSSNLSRLINYLQDIQNSYNELLNHVKDNKLKQNIQKTLQKLIDLKRFVVSYININTNYIQKKSINLNYDIFSITKRNNDRIYRRRIVNVRRSRRNNNLLCFKEFNGTNVSMIQTRVGFQIY